MDVPDRLNKILKMPDDKKQEVPLETWNPPFCGTMPLKVDSTGQWWHEGRLIRREKMIQLFARVLWREDDQYFLKTPVEKVAIEVEDVPLLVTHLEDQTINDRTYIFLKTIQGDRILISKDHTPFMRTFNNQARPYVRIRRNIEALINRNTFYHLLALGDIFEDEHGTGLKIISGDFEFVLNMPI